MPAGEADNKWPLMRHLPLVRAAMETHSRVASVQEQALYFIGNLAHDTENKPQLLDMVPLVGTALLFVGGCCLQ
jgi:hypothetical protein